LELQSKLRRFAPVGLLIRRKTSPSVHKAAERRMVQVRRMKAFDGYQK
jgi:hypothetical protein